MVSLIFRLPQLAIVFFSFLQLVCVSITEKHLCFFFPTLTAWIDTQAPINKKSLVPWSTLTEKVKSKAKSLSLPLSLTQAHTQIHAHPSPAGCPGKCFCVGRGQKRKEKNVANGNSKGRTRNFSFSCLSYLYSQGQWRKKKTFTPFSILSKERGGGHAVRKFRVNLV